MRKLKKYQKIEILLNHLVHSGQLNMEELKKLHLKDLVNYRELEGIGERTIRNILNEYKIKKGLVSAVKGRNKRQCVFDYLENQMQKRRLSVDRLMKIGYRHVKDAPELAEVGKTTIVCALRDFKQQYNNEHFEESIISFITKEKEKQQPEVDETEEIIEIDTAETPKSTEESINKDDIVWIKKMVKDYRNQRRKPSEFLDSELSELKDALSHFGIDANRMVSAYKEEVTKNYVFLQNVKQNLISPVKSFSYGNTDFSAFGTH